MIAICVGHSRKVNGRPEGGAVATNGVSEHAYNTDVARLLSDKLAALGIGSVVISQYGGASYWEAQRWLGREISRYPNVVAAIELHFNSSDSPQSNGYEFLHWHTSSKGKTLANAFKDAFQKNFPALKNRGAKSIDGSDRGALFLQRTHCPALICEPFFGSNPAEVAQFATETGKATLATTYAAALQAYLKATK